MDALLLQTSPYGDFPSKNQRCGNETFYLFLLAWGYFLALDPKRATGAAGAAEAAAAASKQAPMAWMVSMQVVMRCTWVLAKYRMYVSLFLCW